MGQRLERYNIGRACTCALTLAVGRVSRPRAVSEDLIQSEFSAGAVEAGLYGTWADGVSQQRNEFRSTFLPSLTRMLNNGG